MSVLEQRQSFTAERRAIQQYLADLPDPAEYAHEMPLFVAEALLRAVFARDGWRAADDRDALTLRHWGLCEFPTKESRGRHLTNFGRAVRKVLAA